MTLEAEVPQLWAENRARTEQVAHLLQQIQPLQEQQLAAPQRLTELEQRAAEPPPFGTPTRPQPAVPQRPQAKYPTKYST